MSAMLPDNELRAALDGMLQQMVLLARMAAIIRRVADIAGPLPDQTRATLHTFGEQAEASIRNSLTLAEREIANSRRTDSHGDRS